MHTMEYRSALEKKEILAHATWMSLEDITLSGVSQTQEDQDCPTPLCDKRRAQEAESRTVVARDYGEGMASCHFTSIEFQSGKRDELGDLLYNTVPLETVVCYTFTTGVRG